MVSGLAAGLTLPIRLPRILRPERDTGHSDHCMSTHCTSETDVLLSHEALLSLSLSLSLSGKGKPWNPYSTQILPSGAFASPALLNPTWHNMSKPEFNGMQSAAKNSSQGVINAVGLDNCRPLCFATDCQCVSCSRQLTGP